MAVRAPQLHLALRSFTLGAFAYLLRELDDGAELPVAFVEHEHAGGPALYEYRPLVRASSRSGAAAARARRCADRARGAAARARRGDLCPRPRRAAAVRGRGAVPHRPARSARLDAEACGGFDWDDDSFDRAYAELERSLFGERRTYTAVAPLVGISVATQLELAPGTAGARGRRRRARPPLARGGSMVPKDFGRETDRYCVLELRAALAGAEDPPDAPAEIADAVSAIRLATAAPLVGRSGPLRDARRPAFGIRPVLPIAATQPPASRPGSTRSAGRSRASCSSVSASPTPTARSPRHSTAGSFRCSRTSRSAPTSCAPASLRFSARPGRSVPRCCSRPSRRRRRRCMPS